MGQPTTIRLFLITGSSKGLRTAEISNWSGMALAGPRSELRELLARPELDGAGIYLLLGSDEKSGEPLAYIGEAETVRDRLRQHIRKPWWVQAIVVTSKDENLSKGHVRYLEGRLIEMATLAKRVALDNSQAGRAKLSESDTADMEAFLERAQQLLPILGSDLLIPQTGAMAATPAAELYEYAPKGLSAKGKRTETGFAVLVGSSASLKGLPSASKWVKDLRSRLVQQGVLEKGKEFYRFTQDYEFASPSAAAAAVNGGNVAGPLVWKTEDGKTLKQIEAAKVD